jgi:multidrug efflux system membrane fusion protein
VSDYQGEREEKATQPEQAQPPDVVNRQLVKPKMLLIICLFVTLGIGAVFALRSGTRNGDAASASEADRSVIVHVVAASAGDMGVYVDALGTVTPVSTVNIFSQVSGRVLSVNYREGQIVRRGDLLIEIDPRPYQAQLQQAEGLLEHDRGVLKQAEIDLARYREAFASHAVAKQVLDDQEQAVVQDQGVVKYDLGQVEYAEVQLSYCHITAPVPGRVGLRLVDSGNTVFAGSAIALAVITELQPITVVFNVAEDHLGEIETQLRRQKPPAVEAFDRSAEIRLATGALLTMDNQVDTSTGTVRFRGEFSNRDLSLFPNQFVNARLLVRTLKNSVLIPNAAIQRNGSQAFVFVVQNNKVSIRNITERSTDGKMTAVAGLSAGEMVALSSFDKLQDGTPVIVNQPPQDAAHKTGAAL